MFHRFTGIRSRRVVFTHKSDVEYKRTVDTDVSVYRVLGRRLAPIHAYTGNGSNWFLRCVNIDRLTNRGSP